MSDPFEKGHGLVGGLGDLRRIKRRQPPLEHRVILDPYENPAHTQEAVAFLASGPPLEVEIGFGRGHFLRDRIRQASEHRFLGFEVRRMWVSRMARFCDREGVENTRVVLADARPLLNQLLPLEGVTAVYVFFPDPWWKKRHHKRRVMSAATVDVLHPLMKPGATLHVRTDVPDYAGMVADLMAADDRFTAVPAGVDATGLPLPLTHREKKCEELGIDVFRRTFART